MRLGLQLLEPRLALTVADTTAPAVKSIAALKAGIFGTGSTLSFKVTFSEKVVVTGVPTLPIAIGESIRQAAWNRKGSGGSSLVFTTAVQSGDLAPTGVSIAGPLGLTGSASIRDQSGNSLIPAAAGAFPKTKVDAVGPRVTGFGVATVTPRLVSLSVTFSEPVTVRGKPSIPFTIDGAPRRLVYQSGSWRNVLTFSYKPANAEVPTAASVSLPTQVIDLNGGVIVDMVRNTATSLAKPSDLQLSAASVPENQSSGTLVGTFSAVDADGSRDRHTYALVSGAGSTDNESFAIAGNELRTAGSFDFEAKNSYSVRVRATDSGGLSIEKTITISVANVDDVVIQFVRVGDAGNAADTNPAGCGAVGYEYRIGTYETTIEQYARFLNAVAKTDTYGLYSTFMATNLNVAGISRSGASGEYSYSVIGGSGNKPITYVSWFDAARFANWMHNCQPTGSQNPATTEDGAYTLDGSTDGVAPARNVGARFHIPTEDEWYKAAYYKGGGLDAGYWDYATSSDAIPANTIGGGVNLANYYADKYAVTQSPDFFYDRNYLTDVGTFSGSPSPYGTFDQSGNAWEWNDLGGSAGSSRGYRGGYWYDYEDFMSSTYHYRIAPSDWGYGFGSGFRLASPA